MTRVNGDEAETIRGLVGAELPSREVSRPRPDVEELLVERRRMACRLCVELVVGVNAIPENVVYPVMHRQLSAEFDRFVLDRSTALLRTAVLLVGDRGHAEDILQTALLRLATRWRSVHGDPEAYVRRVLVNLARDRWRRASRRVPEQELEHPAQLSTGCDPADTVVRRDALRRALADLPRRQREVIVLRFFVDLSVAETAETLRTSEGTVKAHTSRAVARLRRSLGEQIKERIHGV